MVKEEIIKALLYIHLIKFFGIIIWFIMTSIFLYLVLSDWFVATKVDTGSIFIGLIITLPIYLFIIRIIQKYFLKLYEQTN